MANLLKLPQVKAKVAMSRASIYAKIAAGDFPRAVNQGPRGRAWLESDIEAWIAERVEASADESDSIEEESFESEAPSVPLALVLGDQSLASARARQESNRRLQLAGRGAGLK